MNNTEYRPDTIAVKQLLRPKVFKNTRPVQNAHSKIQINQCNLRNYLGKLSSPLKPKEDQVPWIIINQKHS